MNNQRVNTQKSNRRWALVWTALALMLVMVCTMAIAVSAAGTTVTVTAENLEVHLTQRGDGVYTKVYDGVVEADVEIKTQPDFGTDDVTLAVESASFDSVNVGENAAIVVSFKLTGADAGKYETPADVRVPVVIEKKPVTWTANGTATTVYDPTKTTYADLAVTVPGTDKLDGVLAADLAGISFGGSYTVSVNANGAGTAQGQVLVDIGNANYTLAPLTVDVTVEKVPLVQITWSTDDFSFVYGDNAAYEFTAVGYDAAGNAYPMKLVYPDKYGNACAADAPHYVSALPVDEANVTIGSALNSKSVIITPAVYVVGMDSVSYIGDGSTVFKLGVNGTLPKALADKITYADKATGAAFAGTAAYGKYTVVATLPADPNAIFTDKDGNVVTTLEAVLCVNRSVVASTGAEGDDFHIIVAGQDGFDSKITANVSIPESLGDAIRGFRIHKAYSLALSGVGANDRFTLLISVSEELLNKNCDTLSEKDLYIYDAATGTLVQANTKYTVTLKDGYYSVEGYEGEATTTFVIAPVYHTPFFLTAPGIALIVILVIALIIGCFFYGMHLRRVAKGVNDELVVDTEGETPEVVENEPEDVAAEDALDALADEIAADIVPEVEEAAVEVDVEEEKAAALQEMLDEAAKETLDDGSAVAEEYADQKAEELAETVEVEAAEQEADEEALRAAVAAAMADMVNESADAENAVVILPEEVEILEEFSAEDFREVVNTIVCGAMTRTMILPTEEEGSEETTDAVEEPVIAEQPVADAPVAETEEADEAEDVAAVVANVVAEAFELLAAEGVEARALPNTTRETVAAAVEEASADAIPEDWSEELAAEVKISVVEELSARLVAEVAVEAFATVEDEDDDDNDNDEDEDDEESYGGFGGFAGLKLHYIDVKAEPEEYAALLEQEAAGEIKIVYRLKKSFTSRVIQSQGNVQAYYSAIKNELLSFKGNKGRISWNYEAFNKGRVHVAKINAKLKTLYLYLALDPEELADTKYGIIDVSSKKKYASVPVLMKIKGERKFKYAIELIEKLCGEQMQLPKLEAEAVDYTMAYKTTEELIEEGTVKKLAAGVPIAYFRTEESAAESPAAEPAIEAVAAVENTADTTEA